MTQNKTGYEAPSTAIFVVQTQRVMCTSPGAWDDSILGGSTWGGDGTGFGLE